MAPPIFPLCAQPSRISITRLLPIPDRVTGNRVPLNVNYATFLWLASSDEPVIRKPETGKQAATTPARVSPVHPRRCVRWERPNACNDPERLRLPHVFPMGHGDRLGQILSSGIL
jgi:hypothetical protein